jgi:hypothetical protein
MDDKEDGMDRVSVTLDLPENVVEQAREAGLLTSERLERLLLVELDRQKRITRFFDTLDRLSAIEPRLTMEEINAEIAAYRQEKGQRKKDSPE